MKKNQKKTVSIVIPNWNGKHLLIKHLPYVIRACKRHEIIVVDDASTDGSVELLKKTFPKIKVIAKVNRVGFAGTANTGVEHAHGDIVVLLNTDVRPERNFLQSLVEHFSDPRVFAVGSLEKSVEQGKTVLRGRGLARWLKGFFIHSRGEVDKTDTAWVSGGSGAFDRHIWNLLGGMDTIYSPFYWEDIDLSYRAIKVGYKLVFEPKSIVWHFHEEGKIKKEYTAQQVQIIAYRNQFVFIWKNLSDRSLWAQHIFWLSIRILQQMIKGNIAMMRGFLYALSFVPKIIAMKKPSVSKEVVKDADVIIE